MRLFTRRGHDWTDRYPETTAVAAKLRAKSFTLDGKAAVSGADGVAVFEALHRRRSVPDAVLHTFDLREPMLARRSWVSHQFDDGRRSWLP